MMAGIILLGIYPQPILDAPEVITGAETSIIAQLDIPVGEIDEVPPAFVVLRGEVT